MVQDRISIDIQQGAGDEGVQNARPRLASRRPRYLLYSLALGRGRRRTRNGRRPAGTGTKTLGHRLEGHVPCRCRWSEAAGRWQHHVDKKQRQYSSRAFTP